MHLSLRRKLTIAFLLLAVLPLGAAGVFIVKRTYDAQLDQAVTLQREIAKRAANELAILFHEYEDQFLSLAKTTDLLEQSRERQANILAIIRAHRDHFHPNILEEIVLRDRNGALLAAASHVQISPTFDLTAWPPVDTALDSAHLARPFSYASVRLSDKSREPLLFLSVPVLDYRTGEVAAVLTTSINLNNFWERIVMQPVGKQGTVFVMDNQGRLLAHSDLSLVLGGASSSTEGETPVVAGFRNGRAIRVLERLNIGGSVFFVGVDRPLEEALALTRRMLFSIVFFLLAAAAAGVFFGHLATGRLLRPVQELATTAKAVSGGDYRRRAATSSGDELGVLADSFNEMTEKLLADIEKRKQTERDLLVAQIELQRFSQSLESQVAARTEELARTHAALQDANRNLDQRVRERTAELEATTRRLEEAILTGNQAERERQEAEVKALVHAKLASLGEIATGIAHEINQPLSYIRIIFEVFRRDLELGRTSSEEIIDDSTEALRQVDRISRIIDHLRTFSRSDPLVFTPLSLQTVFANALILVGEKLRLAGVRLVQEWPADLPPARACGHKLEQVFINLLQNSLDALQAQGGGTVRVAAERRGADTIMLTVSDDGPGVPEELRGKIFEPFFTTKEAGRGTGMGLAVSYGIMKEHGGLIECQKSEPRGASFLLTLPVAGPK